uniref:Ras-related protein Rab-28 n=1 Tax=Lygus hesperus TaxID=30085 RepID=A0A0K8TF92_LYGHE
MEPTPTDDDYFERQIKLVLVGEQSSGKTCIVNRLCNSDFTRQYYPTYGVDFVHQRHEVRSGKTVSLIIWDVSGAALNSSLLPCYLHAAQIIFVVFDITNAASYSKAAEWLTAIKNIDTGTSPTIALIANKSDMEHQRCVTSEKQNKFANEHGLANHTVSARTGENLKITVQKACADRLGLKLSRVEQEAHQSVVRAEIIAPSQNQVYPTYQPTPSTICSIM